MNADRYGNRDLILDHERRFAGRVAVEVVDKPVLSLWMIMIPIFFVFYFFQFKRYKNGLKSFAQNFLVTRERVLEAVCEAGLNRSGVDFEALEEVSDSPPEVTGEYRVWLETLADHFQVLISADGASYQELVRNGYRNRVGYRGALERLSQAEEAYNQALAAYLPGEPETISRIVDSICTNVRQQRRSQVADMFP